MGFDRQISAVGNQICQSWQNKTKPMHSKTTSRVTTARLSLTNLLSDLNLNPVNFPVCKLQTCFFFPPPKLSGFVAGTSLILEEAPQWDHTQAQRGALLVEGLLNERLLQSQHKSRIPYRLCHWLPACEVRLKHDRKYIVADKVNGFNCRDSLQNEFHSAHSRDID